MYSFSVLLKTNCPERKFCVMIGILQYCSIISTVSTVIPFSLPETDFSLQVIQHFVDSYAAIPLLLMAHFPVVPVAACTLVLI